MTLSIGIIGLPNVGKSTVFNALTGAQKAQVANFPFCTIHPNRAIVPLKDKRLQDIQSIVKVPNIIFATIEFVDIAGLVKGSSHGEGLGNQFLSQVRNTEALIHVVRSFDDSNIIHVNGNIDPKNDIEIINIELALADLNQLDKYIKKLESDIKGDKTLIAKLELTHNLRNHLSNGYPASTHPDKNNETFISLERELRFLTSKPIIYAVNVDEAGLGKETQDVELVRGIAKMTKSEVIVLCAKLEEEMIDMTAEEQQEFLEIAGVTSSGLDQVVEKGFHVLGLISFFTKNENEVRAWNIPGGTKAPKAAGVIHTDFERGFIRAEVIPHEIFVKYGSEAAIKTAGLMRLEGKDYIVKDGDIIFFRFNV